MLKYEILKEPGTSYTQKLVLTYNARQNIWAKVNKLMKVGLQYNIIFGVIIERLSQSFISENETDPNLRIF